MSYRNLRVACACILVASTCALSDAVGHSNVHRIDINNDRTGSAPVDFEFLRTGEGEVGKWMVVPNATAVAKVSIEPLSEDKTECRFSVAAYKPLSAKNLAVRARVKVIEGTMERAGIAVRVQDRNNNYVVSSNTLEGRIDLLTETGGRC